YSQRPILLAWLDTSPTEVRLANDTRATQVGTTLLYSEMPVQFGTGAISLPRGMMAARIVENDGGICYGPGMASLAPDFREAEIQWELPDEVKPLDPSALSLYVSSDGGWFSAPTMSLYNFAEERWQEILAPVMGRNIMEAPDTFLSENGIIRLRIENPSPNQGGCLYFDASLEGDLPADVSALVR
ncbi:MAG: hypothetical protein ACRD1H_13605, partial [Vicinamibacterales bacterium]